MTPLTIAEVIANPTRKVVTRDGRKATYKGELRDRVYRFRFGFEVEGEKDMVYVDQHGWYFSHMDSKLDMFFK